MIGGLSMAVIGMLGLLRITPADHYWTTVFPSLAIMSIGMAGVFIPASSTALNGVARHDSGIASALLSTSQQVGGSVGLALLSTLSLAATNSSIAKVGMITVVGADGVTHQVPAHESLVAGFHAGFFWGAVLLTLGLIAATWLVRVSRKDFHAVDEVAEEILAVGAV